MFIFFRFMANNSADMENGLGESCRRNLLADLQKFEDECNVDMMGVKEAAPMDIAIEVQNRPWKGEEEWLKWRKEKWKKADNKKSEEEMRKEKLTEIRRIRRMIERMERVEKQDGEDRRYKDLCARLKKLEDERLKAEKKKKEEARNTRLENYILEYMDSQEYKKAAGLDQYGAGYTRKKKAVSKKRKNDESLLSEKKKKKTSALVEKKKRVTRNDKGNDMRHKNLTTREIRSINITAQEDREASRKAVKKVPISHDVRNPPEVLRNEPTYTHNPMPERLDHVIDSTIIESIKESNRISLENRKLEDRRVGKVKPAVMASGATAHVSANRVNVKTGLPRTREISNTTKKQVNENHLDCESCGKNFKTKFQQNHHINTFLKSDVNVAPIEKTKFRSDLYQRIVCENKRCCATFDSVADYEQHSRTRHNMLEMSKDVWIFQETLKANERGLICSQCRSSFSTKSALDRHVKEQCAGEVLFECDVCKDFFSRSQEEFLDHLNTKHPACSEGLHVLENVHLEDGKKKDMKHYKPEVLKSTLTEKFFLNNQTIYRTFCKLYTEVTMLEDVFTHHGKMQMKEVVRNSVVTNGSITAQFCIPCIVRKNDGIQDIEREHVFATKAEIVNGASDVNRVIKKAERDMYAALENLEETGSGWSLSHCKRFDITVSLRNGVRGGRSNADGTDDVTNYAVKRCQGYERKLATSGRAAIMPRYMARGLLDIKNDDDMCFKYACLALRAKKLVAKDVLNAKKKADKKNIKFTENDAKKIREDPSTYLKYEHLMNFDNIQFPAGLDDMKTMEKNNPQVCFNVWQVRGVNFYRVYQTQSETIDKIREAGRLPPSTMQLVLAPYIDVMTKELMYHWFPVVNIKAWATQHSVTAEGNIKSGNAKEICPYCCMSFSRPTPNTGLTQREFAERQGDPTNVPILDPESLLVDEEGKILDPDTKSESGLYTAKYLTHVRNCQFNTGKHRFDNYSRQ